MSFIAFLLVSLGNLSILSMPNATTSSILSANCCLRFPVLLAIT
nr:MAG TPA: hypothetical protein [Caudoviricetes sp.]